MARDKVFVVTRTYSVRVPEEVLERIEKEYPDTSVEADLIDAATRYSDTGDTEGTLYLYRNTESSLLWDDEPLGEALMEVPYKAEEYDNSYDASHTEVDHKCERCGAVNMVTEGVDPGEYRCVKCSEWL